MDMGSQVDELYLPKQYFLQSLLLSAQDKLKVTPARNLAYKT